ncbi:MAG: hypothetical protein ACF788_06600 [Novipirellula sp. JB048]
MDAGAIEQVIFRIAIKLYRTGVLEYGIVAIGGNPVDVQAPASTEAPPA